MLDDPGKFSAEEEYKFKIVTRDKTYDDSSLYTLSLQFPPEVPHEIWQNYVLPDVSVCWSRDRKLRRNIGCTLIWWVYEAKLTLFTAS